MMSGLPARASPDSAPQHLGLLKEVPDNWCGRKLTLISLLFLSPISTVDRPADAEHTSFAPGADGRPTAQITNPAQDPKSMLQRTLVQSAQYRGGGQRTPGAAATEAGIAAVA